MRKDIKIGINTEDIVFGDILQATVHPVKIMSEGDTYLDIQITVPVNYNLDKLWTDGLVFNLSYIPIYKPMRFYICKDYGEGELKYLVNITNNTYLFPVFCGLYGGTSKAICASQLITVNSDFVFRIIGDKQKGVLNLYSGVESDFVVMDSNTQNSNLLLKCVPSNFYRYPTSGVGLVLYLNSNISSSELADIVKKEFENDNVTINSASFDSETGELIIDKDTTKADGNV